MSLQTDSGKSGTREGSSKETQEVWKIQTTEGESLGPFTEATILRGLRDGWLRPNDSASRDEQNQRIESLVKTWYVGKYSALFGLIGFSMGLVGGVVFATSRLGISVSPTLTIALLVAFVVFCIVEVAIIMRFSPGAAGCLGAIGLIVFLIIGSIKLGPAFASVIGHPEGEGFKALILFIMGPAFDFVLEQYGIVLGFFAGGLGAGYGLGYVFGRFLARRECDLRRLPKIRQPVPPHIDSSSKNTQ